MIEDLAYDVTAQEAPFAAYAEPPWLLHLSGELDLCGAPALTKMLERPTERGGTVGLDLADLTYIDSSGLRVILNTVGRLGERGRVVMFQPSPVVRRLIELCGLDGMIDISDHPSSPHFLDLTEGRSRPRPPRTRSPAPKCPVRTCSRRASDCRQRFLDVCQSLRPRPCSAFSLT